MSLPLIVVYALSSIGSIGGGWLPKLFIDRGMGAGRARKRSMLLYALLPLLVLFAQAAGDVNMWYAILIISIACAAHCAFAANLFATVSDMFPKRAVATVTGIGGMGGAVGGILIAKLAAGCSTITKRSAISPWVTESCSSFAPRLISSVGCYAMACTQFPGRVEKL